MNINVKGIEEEIFSLEDYIVHYSSIELTHANDNEAPIKVVITKFCIGALILAGIVGLFFL